MAGRYRFPVLILCLIVDEHYRPNRYYKLGSLDAPMVSSYNPRSTQTVTAASFPEGNFQIVTTTPASPTVFRLASRLDDIGFSDIVNIRNRVMELKAKGATVYQFEGGEPYVNTPDFVKDAMVRALEENKTRYAPSSGIAELRAALADKLRTKNSIPAQAADVIVLNGGMQGLFGAFQSVVNPGEEVLVFSPYWTPIKDLIAHCQATAVLVPTSTLR